MHFSIAAAAVLLTHSRNHAIKQSIIQQVSALFHAAANLKHQQAAYAQLAHSEQLRLLALCAADVTVKPLLAAAVAVVAVSMILVEAVVATVAVAVL
jgi:hypothetical protein